MTAAATSMNSRQVALKASLLLSCNPIGLAFNSAGDLFVANCWAGSITEITPGGARSTFASGLNSPFGLAFNSEGNLFAGEYWNNDIREFTPDGTQSIIFSSGLSNPIGLAFNGAGDLFVANGPSGNITEITPDGIQSTFTSGLSYPTGLAFQGEPLPVPEPSALGLLAVGAIALIVRRRRNLAA